MFGPRIAPSCDILRHPALRDALRKGLNHIPLKPTDLATAIDLIVEAFCDLYHIFVNMGLSCDQQWLEERSTSLTEAAWQIMKRAAKA